MTRTYCTHFDHRYMSRGLTMIRSLRRVVPGATVWVLCLDDAALNIFRQLNEPGVQPISLAEFEAGDPDLVAAKADGRSLIEYYFSAKPSLITHVMREAKEAQSVTYLDSDLWFFADPEPAFAEAPDAAVLLTPHRFPPNARQSERYGRFNAGWLSFRRSPEGLACLQWWRARCLQWCFDQVDEAGQRFADQRYLDHFAEHFSGVHALKHKGANSAPWNVGGHRLTRTDGIIMIDANDPLLFFHVHGIRPIGKTLYIMPQHTYGSGHDPVLRDYIYRPYLETLRELDRELAPVMPARSQPLRVFSRSAGAGLVGHLRRHSQIARAFARRTLIHVKN